MLSIELAKRVAQALKGRVWSGDSGVVRVYFGGYGSRSESWITSKDDGSPVLQAGRGMSLGKVEQQLLEAGLVTGTVRQTSYGTVLDDVRFVALDGAEDE
jgi:hypothetical protein